MAIEQLVVETIKDAGAQGMKEVGERAFEMPPQLSEGLTEGSESFDPSRHTFAEGDGVQETDRSVIAENRENGRIREEKVDAELKEAYPESEGFEVHTERTLLDKNGDIVRDSENSARRIDFLVSKDDQVIDSIEVTSFTAKKDAQITKEQEIRSKGGNFIRSESGKLIPIPSDVETRIERRP